MANKKSSASKREMRNLRIQQILFVIVGLMVILSMLISMIK
jgi:hypothetical protein